MFSIPKGSSRQLLNTSSKCNGDGVEQECLPRVLKEKQIRFPQWHIAYFVITLQSGCTRKTLASPSGGLRGHLLNECSI